MLGTSAMVKITSIGRWSVFGEVIETISTKHHKTTTLEDMPIRDKVPPCSNAHETCACSMEPEPCACGRESCKGAVALDDKDDSSRNIPLPEEPKRKNLIEWLLRRRKSHVPKREERESSIVTERKQGSAGGRLDEWGVVDRILVGGILISTLTIFGLLFHLGSTTLSSSWWYYTMPICIQPYLRKFVPHISLFIFQISSIEVRYFLLSQFRV